MGTSLGYLTSLFPAATSGGGDLLSALYGYGSNGTSAARQNPILALRAAEKNSAQGIKMTAAEPEVQRAISKFTAAVTNAKSVDQLLADPAVLPVLLTANGLGNQTSYTALATRALTSDLKDPKSLANTLTDTRWKPVVETYDFANKGLSVIQKPEVISTIANAYAEITWRQSLDETTPGLSNALSFRANGTSISSVYQILGDPMLRTVVTTVLGLPLQIALQPLEAQEKAISSRLDITQFKDQKFVEQFAQRYLIAANAAAAGSNQTPSLDAIAVQARGLVV